MTSSAPADARVAPECVWRDAMTVELVKASAEDSDVVWAARVSTAGEKSQVDRATIFAMVRDHLTAELEVPAEKITDASPLAIGTGVRSTSCSTRYAVCWLPVMTFGKVRSRCWHAAAVMPSSPWVCLQT